MTKVNILICMYIKLITVSFVHTACVLEICKINKVLNTSSLKYRYHNPENPSHLVAFRKANKEVYLTKKERKKKKSALSFTNSLDIAADY